MKIGDMEMTVVPISSVNMKGLVKNIFPCPVGIRICPICGGYTHKYTLAVSISNTECVKTIGRVCFDCDAFFSVSIKRLNQLKSYSVNSDSYLLNKSFDVPYNSKFYASLAERIKSIFCQITICAINDIRTYTIVKKRKDANQDNHILHYSEPIALDLLTALTLNEKQSQLKIKNLYWNVMFILVVKIKCSKLLNQIAALRFAKDETVAILIQTKMLFF